MTFSITAPAWDALWDESWQTAYSPAGEPFVEICKTPTAIGAGIFQSIELYPSVWLGIGHRCYREQVHVHYPEAEHPIQLCFLLSGQVVDSNGGELSPQMTLVSGSGIQQQITSQILSQGLEVCVEIVMSPDRLTDFFPDPTGQLPAELNFLVRGNDWQTILYPKSNLAIRQTLQQIINCPYQGMAKRLYLQGKITELMALQFASVLAEHSSLPPATRLKPQTIAQIRIAQTILLQNLENPPSTLELSQRVGLSERTLQRGFRELFGATVFGYVTQQRMIEAEQLLRDRKMTIAEVANRVGYAHLGCFAAAFRRQFGLKPSDCVAGKPLC